MSGYTEGRISEENGILYSTIIGNEQGYQIAIVDHEFSDFPIDAIYANARRLAAAWNACEGMTTDAIEALAGIGSLGDLKASELDTANALLREILDGFDKVADEMIAAGEVIEWEGLVAAQKIRNHLAGKAKGEIK